MLPMIFLKQCFAHKIGIMNNGKINHIFDLNEEIKNKGESFFYEYI